MNIKLRQTIKIDLSNVLYAERHSDNCKYVYQWSLEEHEKSLVDENIKHFVVEYDDEFAGYVILDQMLDSSKSVNLRRIVITQKNLGIGRWVLNEIKSIVFNKYNMHRLWLDVFVDNIKAYELYKKVGFREEGKLIDSYLREDGYASQYIMAILKDEYKNNN